jgi:hypothetical protein
MVHDESSEDLRPGSPWEEMGSNLDFEGVVPDEPMELREPGGVVYAV